VLLVFVMLLIMDHLRPGCLVAAAEEEELETWRTR
jgi:hypothetical protein